MSYHSPAKNLLKTSLCKVNEMVRIKPLTPNFIVDECETKTQISWTFIPVESLSCFILSVFFFL